MHVQMLMRCDIMGIMHCLLLSRERYQPDNIVCCCHESVTSQITLFVVVTRALPDNITNAGGSSYGICNIDKMCIILLVYINC